MYLSLLIVAALVITNVVTFQITREVMQNNYRRRLKAKRSQEWKTYIDGEEGLNAEEVAAKRINESLPIDFDKSFKEYKLASLVIEHEDGYLTVEDHHLIDGEGEIVSLNDFKDEFEETEDTRNIDWMLDSYKVLESITANKDHEIVGGDSKERVRKLKRYTALYSFYKEKYPAPKCQYTRELLSKWDKEITFCSSSLNQIQRFSDFYSTVTDCIGGRHGKDKIDVKDAFVTFVDLSYEDLRIIATQKDEDIFNKQWRHELVTEAKNNSRRIRKERVQRGLYEERNELEEAISMIFNKVDNIDKGVIGTLNEPDIITETYEEAATTVVEDTTDELKDVKTFYAIAAEDIITDEELKGIKIFYVKNDLVEIELIDSITTEPIFKETKDSKAIKKANKSKKTNSVSYIAKGIYEATGYTPVKSLDSLLKGGEV